MYDKKKSSNHILNRCCQQYYKNKEFSLTIKRNGSTSLLRGLFPLIYIQPTILNFYVI